MTINELIKELKITNINKYNEKEKQNKNTKLLNCNTKDELQVREG